MIRYIETSLVSLVLLLLFLFSACDKSTNELFDETLHYASFRDVPGVSEDEIIAVEALQRQSSSFVYGMTLSTESFGENGVVQGFSALFCEWLTDLFDISFVPAVYEWGDLVFGLQNGSIDFTGDLTPTDERRGVYL